MHLFILGLLLLLPGVTYAEVRINEIAWMGTSESANDEWIELYNDGPSQSLDGWVLHAVDDTPLIELEGTIGSGDYYLLERTDDESVPGVPADFIFVGSLANAGEILELRNQLGSLVDRVDGGEAWSLGGDNVSKDTLQFVQGAWRTAQPTPGTSNSSVQTLVEEEESTSSEITAESEDDSDNDKSEKEEMRLIAPPPKLSIDAGADQQVALHTPAHFHALAINEYGKEMNNTRFVWNFGDGMTSEGQTAEHQYIYEGNYIVTLTAHTHRFGEELMATDRVRVHVVPQTVLITHVPHEYIELHNTGAEELNMSDWKLHTGTSVFTVPEGTYIPANGTVKFPYNATHIEGDEIILWYPNGVIASKTSKEEKRASTLSPTVVATPQPTKPSITIVDLPARTEPEVFLQDRFDTLDESYELASVGSAQTDNNSPLWFLGVIGIIGLASTAVLLQRHQARVEYAVPGHIKDFETNGQAGEFTLIDISEKRD